MQGGHALLLCLRLDKLPWHILIGLDCVWRKPKTKRSVMLLLSRDTFTRIVYKVPIKQYL